MTIIIFNCLCINKKLIDITHKQSRCWVIHIFTHAHINIKRDENKVIITTE